MKNAILKISALIGILFIGLIFFLSSTNASSDQEVVKEAQTQQTSAEIPKEEVCMVNDAFMGKSQIEVPVNGKMYYGCCNMCVKRLNESEEIRSAKDPFTKEIVDKASAYIVLDPDSDQDEVLYFKDQTTYQKFMESREQ